MRALRPFVRAFHAGVRADVRSRLASATSGLGAFESSPSSQILRSIVGLASSVHARLEMQHQPGPAVPASAVRGCLAVPLAESGHGALPAFGLNFCTFLAISSCRRPT